MDLQILNKFFAQQYDILLLSSCYEALIFFCSWMGRLYINQPKYYVVSAVVLQKEYLLQ